MSTALTETEQRAAVVAEARTWIGTRYHHFAAIKGVAVDCAMLPAKVYAAAGLIPELTVESYPPDWWMHRSEERYLGQVLEYAHEVAEPGPGDLVLYKFGRCFAHGAIVTEWPGIIHAVIHGFVCEDDGTQGRLTERPRRYFSLWRKT